MRDSKAHIGNWKRAVSSAGAVQQQHAPHAVCKPFARIPRQSIEYGQPLEPARPSVREERTLEPGEPDRDYHPTR